MFFTRHGIKHRAIFSIPYTIAYEYAAFFRCIPPIIFQNKTAPFLQRTSLRKIIAHKNICCTRQLFSIRPNIMVIDIIARNFNIRRSQINIGRQKLADKITQIDRIIRLIIIPTICGTEIRTINHEIICCNRFRAVPLQNRVKIQTDRQANHTLICPDVHISRQNRRNIYRFTIGIIPTAIGQ